MNIIHATVENRIAAYSDGSGSYSIHRDGDDLITVINDGMVFGGEEFAQTLTRAPQFDSPTEDWFQMSEWMLADRFASCPDLGENEGTVWIDGEAFAVAFDDDALIESVPVPPCQNVSAAGRPRPSN